MNNVKKIALIAIIIVLTFLSAILIKCKDWYDHWSIGIYTGSSISGLVTYKADPVLTPKNIGPKVQFVADPFMVHENNKWYMFFEVKEKLKPGYIGYATSLDGFNWTYDGVALKENTHLSYPYIFKCGDEYCMTPESYHLGAVRLYRAIDFPNKWVFVKNLIEGEFVDPSIYFDDKTNFWYLFAGECRSSNCRPSEINNLHLYFAKDLLGPWKEHPMSPIVKKNGDIARPGGRIIKYDDKVYRIAQDDSLGKIPFYGRGVRIFEIEEITPETYKEKEVPRSPFLGKLMHHIDIHQTDKGFIAVGDDRFFNIFKRFTKLIKTGF